MIKSYLITISGIVQGVGFRPFVYNLAKKLNLNGWIFNNSIGVSIHIEGKETSINEFINTIKNNPPELSIIRSIIIKKDGFINCTSFEIRNSHKTNSPQIFISPDVCTCQDCKADILNKDNKRYLYPFTNCTNCGPRFSIIKEVPYDRKVTTMAKFSQCDGCLDEYNNKDNRRFHAQPNCCPDCGPKIYITDNNGVDITSNIVMDSIINSSDYNKRLIDFFINEVKKGGVFAIKSLSGFHLCCSPYSKDAISLLRERKQRKSKPFALMMKDLDTVKKFCYVSDSEEELLLKKSRPIVLLQKKEDISFPDNLAPNNNCLGVMLPSTPLHILLFENDQLDSLVMTSGNLSGLPLEYDNSNALTNLSSFCDYFLLNDRDIFLPLDDSIVKATTSSYMIVRRSRGYVPLPIFMEDSKDILALGGDMKNTFAISKGDYIYLGPHNGELINYESFERFKSNINHYINLFELSPKTIACDLHPLYESSKYYKELDLNVVKIQHHHAHIASCMADNNYTDNVIGIAFDGTGYGDDDAIWGSEFFICNLKEYKRVGHLDYVSFLGGDKSLRDGYKIALSYLYNLKIDDISDFLIKTYPNTWKIIFKLLENPTALYKSSSMGRLFDAVSSLLGLCDISSFEGEGAIALQSILDSNTINDGYIFDIMKNEDIYLLSPLKIIESVLKDKIANLPNSLISLNFHSTIVNYIISMCNLLKREYNISTVALSGGVFQNSFILDNTYKELSKNGFKVLIHKDVPTNDGGIALGQLIIAKNYK